MKLGKSKNNDLKRYYFLPISMLNSSEFRDPPSAIVSYESFRHILLLGEADFSFARAFAKELSDDYPGSGSSGDVTTTSIEDDTGNKKSTTLIRNCSRKISITATEYGDDDDVAKRYFDGDKNSLAEAMNYLCRFDSVVEVMCNLNARQLGEINERKTRPYHSSTFYHLNQNIEWKKERDSHVCKCQRWNVNLKQWEESAFWNNSNEQNYDLVIFNFPHSDQAGRATKLVKALFKQLRICIDTGKLQSEVVLEMRLRTIETNPEQKKNIRSYYNHEESAKESGFKCIGVWSGDLERWEKQGYQHKMTKKKETCSDINRDCKVWRWKSLSL